MKALVIGGASSGKSQRAEDLCCSLGGDLVYLAAMRPSGGEGLARIHAHRARRAGKGFTTIECCEGLSVALADTRTSDATVLLEDLGNVVANRLFDGTGETPAIDALVAEITDGLALLAHRSAHLIVVGNDVGCDGTRYDAETTRYQLLLGRVARAWATHCDLVIECTCGVAHVLRTGGGGA